MIEPKKLLRNPLTYILVASPLLLYALTLLQPVHDDWSYFTTPYYDFGDKFTTRLMPFFSYWRPFDGLFGYVLSLAPGLFPTLNHAAVYTAHLISTVIVYKLCGTFGFNTFARNVATIFFFISPAMLGTVLGIDSLNQAYSQTWGLLGTLAYLNLKGRTRVPAWLACTLVATLCKENGVTFFAIPQVLAYASGKATLRQVAKDTLWAVLTVAAYYAARKALYNDNVYINDEYFENTLSRKLKNLGVFVGMTWIPLDYVSLWHAASRNLATVAITAALSMPFILYLFFSRPRNLRSRLLIGLAVAMLVAASPHLLTLFTAMHPYASLGMAALVVAFLADNVKNKQTLTILFAMFIASTAYVDWHHWQKSYESSMTGKRMGQEAIKELEKPADKLSVIYIDRGEQKYSSFCAIPYDAFGWGWAIYKETGYEWPRKISNVAITEAETQKIDSIADSELKNEGSQRVLLVYGDTVKAIR